MNPTNARRRSVLLLLLALCQGTLVLHDGQHALPDVGHCVVCGHSVPSVPPTADVLLAPVVSRVLVFGVAVPAAAATVRSTHRAFRSRAPPAHSA